MITDIFDDLRSSLLSNLFTDFKFIVKDKIYSCHKVMLYIRCEEYYNENNIDTINEIKIEDSYSCEKFGIIIEFIYTDKVNINKETAVELLSIAKHFKLERLVSICENKINSLDNYKASTILIDLEKLINNEKLSDITFIVEGNEIKIHKYIMAARCEYYRALWNKNWAESSENVLIIDNFSYDSFLLFIRYIYTNNIRDYINGDVVVDLLSIATQFNMNGLKSICEQYIITGIDSTNALSLYQIADLYSARRLKLRSLNYIKSDIKNIMKSDEWSLLSKQQQIDLTK